MKSKYGPQKVKADPAKNVIISYDTRTGSTKQEQPTCSAAELMKLPLKERLKILACTAGEAEAIYSNDKRLTDFEAFGEDDLYGTPL